MKIDDPKIVALRRKVSAAIEEFDAAIAFHEVWKRAAHDRSLHRRIGRSRAGNTFLVVRQALRQEMLLATMRLWDNKSKAVGMKSIANTLDDGRVMDALVAEREAQWPSHHLGGLQELPEEERAEFAKAIHLHEVEVGRSQGTTLRQNAKEAIAIIESYSEGGARHATLEKLKTLRNGRLAHRQIVPTPVEVAGAASYNEIETFYQDMFKLIGLLTLTAGNSGYDLNATAERHRRNATLFWAPMRGERTEGHPKYRRSPRQQRRA